jgi:four helix bundle protein
MRTDRENIIADKTFQFALKIVGYCELLEENRKFVIARQLLKSGTSIGANVREAQNAESNADFIHKMKIAAKEIDETDYWLLICKYSPTYPFNEKLLDDLTEINKIMSKILSTLMNK